MKKRMKEEAIEKDPVVMKNARSSCCEVILFFILAGGHVRASAGALAVHTALILAEGHVREAPWTWRSTAL